MSESKHKITIEFDSEDVKDAFLSSLTSNGVESTIDIYMLERGFQFDFDYSKCWKSHGASEEQVNNPTLLVTAEKT